ncbi:hypothetical protein RZS08_01185, partial [Arthrospira platensis SPKY1]|nr:hypothetical protein [Arthrospira platensis SPKY1]
MFDDLLKFVIITEVFELIVPSVGDFSDFDFDLLVLFIIGLVITGFDIIEVIMGVVSGTFEVL